MNRIRRAYVDTAYGQIHYRSLAGDGIPLVLLHQIPSSSAMYERLMTELTGIFPIIALDTPGFGNSDRLPTAPKPPRWLQRRTPTEARILPHLSRNEKNPEAFISIAAYAKVLYEALNALNVRECWLFGHHTGAAIAVQMMYEYPHLARKVVLCGVPYLSSEQKTAWRINAPTFELREDGSHLLAMWLRIRGKSPDVPLELSERETLLGLQAAEQYASAYRAVSDHDFERQLAALACPVLVMAGEHDSLRASLEPAYAALKNGTVRMIEGADSYVCDRQADVVATILREYFLDG
jgi:haloalkane dehalogenase